MEGTTDARVLSHLTGYQENVDIRTADEIDTSSTGNDFCSGNKAKLQNLATFAEQTGFPFENLLTFCDFDFGIFYHPIPSPFIVYTDHANLFASSVNRHWLSGFFIQGYGLTVSDEHWCFFISVLKKCFLYRYYSAQNSINLAAPDIAEFVSYADSIFSFNWQAYVTKYFGTHTPIDILNFCVTEIEPFLPNDLRYAINTNDLFSLAFAMLRRSKRISGSTPRDAIKNGMLGAGHFDIATLPKLGKIVQWAENFDSL